MCSITCINVWISLKFCIEVYLSQIYVSIVFGEAAPSVPSFIGSRYLVDILVCALSGALLDGFLSCFVWRPILVKSTLNCMIWWCCPHCSIFYRVKGHTAKTAASAGGYNSVARQCECVISSFY